MERVRWMEAFLDHADQRGAAGALVWLYEPPMNPVRKHSIRANDQDLPSRRVRRLLRAKASQFEHNLRGGVPKHWSRRRNLPQFAAWVETRGQNLPHRGFTAHGPDLVLDMSPGLFARTRFEQAGFYQGHALDTLWGRGEGYVTFRFLAPRGVPRSVVIAARISSELPGAGDGGDPRDATDVEISLDGELMGTVRAQPDDGLGAVVQVELSDQRALQRIFASARRHELRFTALPSAYAGGLCIYGAATGAQPVPEQAARELQAVRVILRQP
jgi:hypothetical protein